MCYEIMLSIAFQYVIFCNGQVGELQGSKIVKKIGMIATYINDFRTVFFHHFHDDFKKVRVFRFPFADAGFLQMPSVDDVTVQNQSSAV